MPHPDLELFDANPLWRLVLAAYQCQPLAADGEWLSRRPEVESVPAEQLSGVHGKLIALGFLRFELGNRTEGVKYRVSPFGRQALLAPHERASVVEWQPADDQETAAA